jgi:hypothetical protein
VYFRAFVSLPSNLEGAPGMLICGPEASFSFKLKAKRSWARKEVNFVTVAADALSLGRKEL